MARGQTAPLGRLLLLLAQLAQVARAAYIQSEISVDGGQYTSEIYFRWRRRRGAAAT